MRSRYEFMLVVMILIMNFSAKGSTNPKCYEAVVRSSWNACIGSDPQGQALYYGEFNNGAWHGRGMLTYPNGDRYIGSWKDGMRHGFGTFIRADGSELVRGEWEVGGESRVFIVRPFALSNRPVCDVYIGDTIWTDCRGTKIWSDGVSPSGARYVGEFVSGGFSGVGTEFYTTTKEQYVGDFYNGKPHGTGIHIYSNGAIYSGELREGLPNGLGWMASPDGQADKEGVWEGGQFVRLERIADELAGRSPRKQIERPQAHVTATNDIKFDRINDAKVKCKDLGFKPNSEKFGECVLRLSR